MGLYMPRLGTEVQVREVARAGRTLRFSVEPGEGISLGSESSLLYVPKDDETPYLAVEMLLEIAAAGITGSVLDVGCGSGVIALAAAALGFAPVWGIDHKPVAVERARGNAAVNNLAATFDHASVQENWRIPNEPHVLFANVPHDVLGQVITAAACDPPPHVVLFVVDWRGGWDLDDAVDELVDAGYRERLRLSREMSGAAWLSADGLPSAGR